MLEEAASTRSSRKPTRSQGLWRGNPFRFKKIAHFAIVCPGMEYAYIWDTYFPKDINALDKFQN